ncbi:MAG TPA: MATE family efflux transporter [Thermoanaerobaculia bacterium]|nr:MATE family efflux transporter [Thermoanaerobaculia bacterium]
MSESIRTELRALTRLALPLAAAQAGTQLMGLVDVAVLGRLGATELGAAGLGNSLFFALAILGMGIVMGIDPLVSQALGAGEETQARRVLWQGVWISNAVGFGLMIPMALSPRLLPLLGIEQTLVEPAALYVRIRMLSLPFFMMFIALRAYLQAHGIVRPMIVAMVIGNVFNLVADVVLVFGGSVLPAWTGPLRSIPAYGVAGAAVASVVAAIVQLAVLAAAIRAIPLGSDAPANLRAPDRRLFAQGMRVGLPVGFQMGAEVGIFALVGLIAGKFGEAPLAAHQVALTLAAFTFTAAVGIGAAGSVRVGRAIGARDREQTRRAGLAAFIGGGGFMAFMALLFWILPRQLSSLLTNQEPVIRIAIPLLAVAAVFQISDGIQGVGAGVLRGAGDTRFAFVANIIGHWLIGFPIALLFGFVFDWGIVGLWWGLCVGLTAVAALLVHRFWRLSSKEIAPLDRSLPHLPAAG